MILLALMDAGAGPSIGTALAGHTRDLDLPVVEESPLGFTPVGAMLARQP